MVAGCVRAAESAPRRESMLNREAWEEPCAVVGELENRRPPREFAHFRKRARCRDAASSFAGVLRVPTTDHDVLQRRPPGCLSGDEDNPAPPMVRGVPRLVLARTPGPLYADAPFGTFVSATAPALPRSPSMRL